MELNAEKVKKALEIHTGILDMPCEECPYNCDAHDEICLDVLAADALALINSQEQRIGELAEEVEDLKVTLLARTMALTTLKAVKKELTEDKEKLGYLIDELVKEKRELWEENKKLTEENERLKAQKYYIHSDDRIEMIPTVESVRADTVRKMQERLKADAVTIQDHTGKLGVVVGVGNIDDVAREMLEGETDGDK